MDPLERNGLRRYLQGVAIGVTTALMVGAILSAFTAYVGQLRTKEIVEANRTLIMACCAEGGTTRSDLRNLTTRFDSFLNNLEKLLTASEHRLQRLEDKEAKR